MSFKSRLKAALKAFINPPIAPKFVAPKPAPEPSIVIDNQLLAGKKVLITGGGRNIGRSIALEMAKQGANIFFTDLERERCENLEKELSYYPVNSIGFVSNISKTEDNDYLFNYLVENNINIDILVNNVGIQLETSKIKDFDLGEWHKTFNTNVFGPMYLTKLISQRMVNHHIHGSIIYITSIHQWEIVCWPSYSSSKAALGMIIKELAIELATSGIRVNGIAPGWVGEDEQGNSLRHSYTPLHNSSINPCYIGRAAVYLASDYFSKFTTGTILKIDAGLSLYNHRYAEYLNQ
jgi:NAD(P)-dependent dehydrogenase (short-subunit alcohol dehydrogenase family)